MQKKKFPVLPVIGIFAVLSVLFVMNATGGNINFSQLFASRDDTKAVQEALSKTNKESNKSALTASIVKSTEPAGPHPEGTPGAPDLNKDPGLPTEPAIFLPKIDGHTETPNESATSSLWWEKGSEVKDKGEEVKKERQEGQ